MPRLVRRYRASFRLQWEPAQNAYVLLYPEGMVKLNAQRGRDPEARATARATVAAIVADLERAFPGNDLRRDVTEFLAHARDKVDGCVSARDLNPAARRSGCSRS